MTNFELELIFTIKRINDYLQVLNQKELQVVESLPKHDKIRIFNLLKMLKDYKKRELYKSWGLI